MNTPCCHLNIFVYLFFNLKSNTQLHTKTTIIILFWFEYSQFTHYFGLRVGWQFIFKNTVRRLWWLTSATTDSAFNSFRGSYFHWVRISCFVAFNFEYRILTNSIGHEYCYVSQAKQKIWSSMGFLSACLSFHCPPNKYLFIQLFVTL